MINSQEIYNYLSDSVLVCPEEDNWESIKNSMKAFLDCWANNQTIRKEIIGDKLVYYVKDLVILFYYTNEMILIDVNGEYDFYPIKFINSQ